MALSSIKQGYNKYPSKEIQERFTVEQLKEMYWQKLTGDVVTRDDTFTITVANYAELFKLNNSNARVELQSAVMKLLDRKIKVETSKKLGFFQWVSCAVFDKETGSASIRFTEEVLPYLHSLQRHFTKIRLSKVIELQSVYSWRFYELFKMRQGENTYIVVEFTLEELYRMMEVPDSRREFFKFNERILKPVLKELEDKNVISLKVKEVKSGRKVVSLVFEKGLKEIKES
jgi:plasmid replication initiation protein